MCIAHTTQTHTVTHTHTKVISMKLYSLRPRLSWMIMKYSLHAFMSMQSFCIYHIYRILFLIYQFQFLFHCVIAAKPKIFSEKFRSLSFQPLDRVPPLLFRLPATHPLVNRCKQKMQVALLSPVFSKHFLWTSSWRSGLILPHGKKLFLFLKHQSSLNKTTVLSQESNNNFLYIWQTGFCIFFSSYFTIPSQLYFLEPEPLWLCLCQFLL